MTERINLVAVTFKIHPRLLAEIDKLVDNVHFRSRAHVINCAVDDWLNSPPKPKVVRRSKVIKPGGKCRLQNVVDIEKKA
jgi:Arc/MetJ-type ribon-helix-helix transcriptional regulator